MRPIDEKTSVSHAIRLREEYSGLEELINTNSCAHLGSFSAA